ncbi:MAG: helix-turn-helix domain-containing protein [Lachnotalea sp.]
MKEKTLGELLEELRTRNKLSKTQVCDGLCTVTALARYEQDKRVPEKVLADYLFERLGKGTHQYELVTSQQEYRISKRRSEIEKLLNKGKVENAEELLQEYKNETLRFKNLHMQYIILKEGEINSLNKEFEVALFKYIQALEYTNCGNIYQCGLEEKLLSGIEIELVYMIAETSYIVSDLRTSYFLFEQLKIYFDRFHTDYKINNLQYSNIMYRLAQKEKEESNFGLSLKYLQDAEEFLIKDYRINNLQEVLQLKLLIQEKLGLIDTENIKKQQNIILALRIMEMQSKNEIISKEGLELWENTVNRQ